MLLNCCLFPVVTPSSCYSDDVRSRTDGFHTSFGFSERVSTHGPCHTPLASFMRFPGRGNQKSWNMFFPMGNAVVNKWSVNFQNQNGHISTYQPCYHSFWAHPAWLWPSPSALVEAINDETRVPSSSFSMFFILVQKSKWCFYCSSLSNPRVSHFTCYF